ncbi:Prohibitin-2, subunit of the prohibitin complex (Phb1p-Phb2p), partial [Coemansia sp. RSA 1937]
MNNPEEQLKEMQRKLQNMFGGKRGGKAPKGMFGLGAAIVTLGALGVGLNASLFNVDGGHRAIKYSRISGIKPEIYSEGTHLRIPWIEMPIIYDVRAKPTSI